MKTMETKYRVSDVVVFVENPQLDNPMVGVVLSVTATSNGRVYRVRMCGNGERGPHPEEWLMSPREWVSARVGRFMQEITKTMGRLPDLEADVKRAGGSPEEVSL